RGVFAGRGHGRVVGDLAATAVVRNMPGRLCGVVPGARIRRCGGAGADRDPDSGDHGSLINPGSLIMRSRRSRLVRLLINAAASAITAAMKFVRRQPT